MMHGVVINPFFDWTGDRSLRIPYNDSVIYEAHVKGLTALHPEVPAGQRGTYAGVAHPAVIDHLTRLGVTAIELMPVHQFVNDSTLIDQGLSNYWGYNTIGFFAPQNTYSAFGERGQQVQEFKAMVKSLHSAGIEVILDVVYNHTAEGNHLGPTLSFRGIDNGAYYRLVEDDKRYYMDYTGTGNTLNVRHPHSLQLLMDSLRYWVTEMHVDGFRFDLAATLAREFYDVDRLSTFFELVQQDPVVSQVKLIAEPWDIGPGGYQVGNFPPQWTEWNGKYRDTVRDFWRGEPATLGEFASRLTGSADLYETSGRRPVASINFVTAHDGFTLADLVSYNEKHNEANGEGNNDGESHNRSWNCGVEGPTDDTDVLVLRGRQQRNFLATLLLSQGVPMIAHGDELGRTQLGNNNTYCQDSELSWVHWLEADEALVEFTASVARLRRQHPTFRRRRFFDGRPAARAEGEPLPDIVWMTPAGALMKPEDWDAGFGRSIGMFLNGNGISGMDTRGQRVVDDSFLLLFNAHDEGMDWVLPPEEFAPAWRLVIDTSGVPDLPETIQGGSSVVVSSKGMVVLQALAGSLEEPTSGPGRRGGADHRARAGSDACRIGACTSRSTTTQGRHALSRPPSRWWHRRSGRRSRRAPPTRTPATRNRVPTSRRPGKSRPPAVAGRRRSDVADGRCPRPPLHLSAADHPGLGSAGRRGPGAVPAGSRHRLGVPLAGAGRRAGFGTRLRRRRPRQGRRQPRRRPRAGRRRQSGARRRPRGAGRHRAQPRRGGQP